MMEKMRALSMLSALAMFAAAAAGISTAQARGNVDGPVIYVTGQDLFYDSIVVSTLPLKGPFQKLEFIGPSGLQTEFGPGDVEYVGGRWWVDVNGNNQMDGGDMFFSCPLLGPGRVNQ